MSRADGSVIIDTKMDTEGVKHGTKEIKKELGEVGESSSKANNSISGDLVGGFKKLGKAILAAGVIDAVADFSKEAIKLGSDLQEVQNVVDVTFTTMDDNVNKFAKDAKKAAGLSETMAKQYVGTFGAMADSFGFTEAEAYEMSTALTQLTGDVASFYNLSQDEAMNKLKGVFTGETEALKELGVVMTQAALDNYALANGYEKTTSAMTEQEKVALRYQFVMDQLSASSGDFVRTQDSWANQSKVLSLQWESLMTTIGSGLISTLSPGLSLLNDKFLPALQDGAEYMAELMNPPESAKLEKRLKNIASSVEDANEAFEDSAKAIDNTAVKAEIYRGMLQDLEETGLATAEAQSQYAHIVEQLNALYPEMNLRISEHTGMLDADSRAQLANLEVMKERALMAALEGQYNAILNAQAEATIAVTDAQNAYNDVQVQKKALIKQIVAETGLEIGQLYELDAAQRKGEKASKELTKAQQATLLTISLLTGEENKLNNTIKKGKKEIEGYDSELDSLRETYGLTGEKAGEFADQQARINKEQLDATSALAKAGDSLDEIQEEYNETKNAALSSIEAQIGAFDELVIKSDKSAADIIKNWESQQEAFNNYSDNLKKAVDMGLDEALVKQLSDGSKESMAILNEFVNSTEASVDEINAAFRKTQESKNIVASAMADIQSDMVGKLSTIYQEIQTTWGEAEAVVKRTMRQMQEDINGLKGKSVTIEVKTQNGSYGYSGKDMSLSNPSLGYSLRSADVPYLASGAVIPPNAPFMAVLGDQRHGTNVEAPLSTIQEAVSNVMSDAILSGFAAMIQEQKVTQEILRNIEIGDTVIGQAVDRYNEANNIMLGGILV